MVMGKQTQDHEIIRSNRYQEDFWGVETRTIPQGLGKSNGMGVNGLLPRPFFSTRA
jgi:hypothetical protein